MYKILLADDEGIVLESLQYIIEKNFKGQFDIEKAKTGRKVIEIVERVHPDIAFVDIQMVGINGIEAMREIRKINETIVFIVLTAYDVFDYAKESVHLGVLEYLNKPIQQKEIIAVLNQAMKQVDEKREKRQTELTNLEKLESFMPVMETGLIDGLLFHDYCDEEITQFKNYLGITSEYGYFTLLQIEEWNQESNPENISRILGKEQGLLREQIKSKLTCLVGAPIENKIPVYQCMGSPRKNAEKEAIIYETWKSLRKKLESHASIRVRVGIGENYPLKEACCSYYQAMEALGRSEDVVACIWRLYEDTMENAYMAELEQEFYEALKEGNSVHCRELSHLVLQFIQKQYEKDGEKNLAAQELYLWFTNRLTTLCSNVRLQREESAKSLVKRGEEYIKCHYSEDISLSEVAQVLGISSHYFSRLFKEKTEMNYIEYLTVIRIQSAKRMLTKSNETIRDICKACGYTDPNYFSRIFKRHVGMTPTVYREERQERT